jgi:hypothetical protein
MLMENIIQVNGILPKWDVENICGKMEIRFKEVL